MFLPSKDHPEVHRYQSYFPRPLPQGSF
jgi:hypothetical protein